MLGPCARAWAANQRLQELAKSICGLDSNRGKVEFYAADPAADLSFLDAHPESPARRPTRGRQAPPEGLQVCWGLCRL